MDDLCPTFMPSRSSIRNQNYCEHQVNMISTHIQLACTIWGQLECVKYFSMVSDHIFVVLGGHVRVLAPINGCHFIENIV